MSIHCKETCYEYFNCHQYDCVRRRQLATHCWEIDHVECKTHSDQFEKLKMLLGSKLEACKRCIYYQQCHEDADTSRE